MADTYSYVSGELRCALFPLFVDGILRNTNKKICSKWSHQSNFAHFLVSTRPKLLLFSNKRKTVKIGQNAFTLNQGDTPLQMGFYHRRSHQSLAISVSNSPKLSVFWTSIQSSTLSFPRPTTTTVYPLSEKVFALGECTFRHRAPGGALVKIFIGMLVSFFWVWNLRKCHFFGFR